MRTAIRLAHLASLPALIACSDTSPLEPPNSDSATVPQGDLVAFFPFRGDASDHSGNRFHGTALGATPTTDRFGAANQAFRFNGAAEVRAPVTFPSSNLTAAAWIHLESYQCWGGILDGFREKWELVMDCGAGDRIQFAEWRSSTSFFNHVNRARLQLRPWYHIAVTIEGTTGHFYLDGVLSSSFQLTASALTSPRQLVMGHSASGTSQFLVGSLDEVRLYSRALDAGEIRDLCRREAAPGHPCQ